MVVVAKELLQYEKDYINYYINIPKLYYNEKNILKNEMIENINQLILEDILTFMDVVEDSYNLLNEQCIFTNSITEFQVGYISRDIISLCIEFSQLSGFSDISYVKGYNYDFKLQKEIILKDLFKKDVDYISILKKYILMEINNFWIYMDVYEDDIINNLKTDDIMLDEDNTFYFDSEYLIIPFSSCEIDEEILNLIEFKISFNKIYPYLNEYAIKNIVKKIVL